jgi:hypothetical protein
MVAGGRWGGRPVKILACNGIVPSDNNSYRDSRSSYRLALPGSVACTPHGNRAGVARQEYMRWGP